MQPNPQEPHYLNKAVDIALRLAILAVLLIWCFQIIRPFINALLWGIVLAVALYPVFVMVKKKTRLGDKYAAALITVSVLALLIIPGYFLMNTLAEEIQFLAGQLMKEDLQIPAPSESVKYWPIIGKPVHSAWLSASQNLEEFIQQFSPQFKEAATWLLEFIFNFGIGIVMFVFATLISGILLANAEQAALITHKLFIRLAGKSGEDFSSISVRTIQNVIKGVIGVAIIQAALASISFFVAGIPGAGLWSVACLIMCVVQVGLFPVAIPIIIYSFSTMDTVPASILCVWLILVSLSDNLLKPMLLGKGAPVPMPVIFIGVIGGFMASGFSGMFVGAIVFSIAYKILLAWLNETSFPPKEELDTDAASGKTTL